MMMNPRGQQKEGLREEGSNEVEEEGTFSTTSSIARLFVFCLV